MSDTKFTPGPWEVAAKAGYPVVFGGNRVLCSPSGYSIGELKSDPSKAAEMLANARLIAAAPDLYEALAEVTHELRRICVKAGVTFDDYPAIEKAFAALSKAGRQ